MIDARNIILIGFMGSGKSTLGKRLAKKLNRFFLDTDQMIENREQKTIAKIFKERGESYFRKEEETLQLWLKDNVKNAVIATGGGFSVKCDVNALGIVVYLSMSFENIKTRVSKPYNINKRPLFKDVKIAEELFKERREIYIQKADLIVEPKENIDDTVRLILSSLRADL